MTLMTLMMMTFCDWTAQCTMLIPMYVQFPHFEGFNFHIFDGFNLKFQIAFDFNASTSCTTSYMSKQFKDASNIGASDIDSSDIDI